MSDILLQPCPFCGGHADYLGVYSPSYEEGNRWRVKCQGDCGTCGPVSFGHEGAALAWNRRANGNILLETAARIADQFALNNQMGQTVQAHAAFTVSTEIAREIRATNPNGPSQTAEVVVDREEASHFFEIISRDWWKPPFLSSDAVDDLAKGLVWFVKLKTIASQGPSVELLDIVKLFRDTLQYYIRRDEKNGDLEGASLKRNTLGVVEAAIAKVEGGAA